MTQKDWILQKLESGLYTSDLYTMYEDFCKATGAKTTKDNYKSLVRRRARESRPEEQATLDKDLLKIKEQYSPAEIRAIVNGGRAGTGETVVPTVDISGDKIKLAIVSDTHIGSRYTSDYHLDKVSEIVPRRGT